MKLMYKSIGCFVGLALMLVLLISSIEYVVYDMDGYFEKEYKKYEVAESINIEMDDLLVVTHEMMAYLKGNRENLILYTQIGNQEREFFNAKEKRHMQDVQTLFRQAQRLRMGSLLFCAIFAIGLLVLKKGDSLFRGIQWGIGLFFGLIGLLSAFMMHNFNWYFTKFHHLFFDNNDWLLNPKTDLLINIVPEGFFRDTSFLVASIFLTSALISWLLSWFLAKRMKTGE